MSFEINMYETRTMLGVIEQRKPVRTFMRETFFGNGGKVFTSEYVDIDIYKGKRRLAPFVNPKHAGKLVEKLGYKTQSYKPAYVKPKIVTTAGELLLRQAGNTIYNKNVSIGQLAAQQLGVELRELDDMVSRREEWMATQALTTGKVDVKGEGVDDVINFNMDSTQLPVLVGTAKWSDHTNSTPLKDLKRWKRERAKASGYSPTVAVFGLLAWDNFLKSDEITGTANGGKNLFDMRRVNVGQIDPQILPNGVTYMGNLTEIGLDIYTYEEWYVEDNSNIELPLIPDNKVFLGNPNTKAQFLYGAIKDLEALAPVERFPKSWIVKDPSVRFLMLQSAPLPVPVEIDAFMCATVL